MTYDVYGIENPLVDINVKVNDSDIKSLGLTKGIMHLIDEKQRNKLFEFFAGRKINRYPAGSCANTMMGIARLGGKAVFSGKVGNDNEGEFYHEAIKKTGVISDIKSEAGLTGTSIILVTPDSERTMNTFLGNCRKYSKKDVNTEILSNSRILYSTGYMWDTDSQKQAALFAFETAKNKGVKIAFSLADPFLVKRNKEDFLEIIKKYADLVISNEEEACSLVGGSVTESLNKLRSLCDNVIITLGKNGSMVADKSDIHRINAFRANCIDTTGAGDLYAAGVLYGLCRNMSLKDSANLGNLFASWIVTQEGVKLF
jgi:sugar/nucleoside kinase (ribokinase family)